MGLFINHVTLKLPFFEPPTPHHHASSRMITRLPLRYVAPDTDTPPPHPPTFLIYFSFLKLKKPQRYAPNHDTSTHVFKQLNQIVRFKLNRIRVELESLFSINYLTRKKKETYVHLSSLIHPSKTNSFCE